MNNIGSDKKMPGSLFIRYIPEMRPHQTSPAKSRGFTLLEMMAVITVIAILSMIAIPTYQDRVVRQQIESGLPLADIAKKPIAAAWASIQKFPSDNTAADLPAPDKIVNNYVSAIEVKDGIITVTFGNRAAGPIKGKILTIRPAVVEDAPVVPVTWVCGKADAPNKMTVKGIDQTTIPAMYLPLECRKLPAAK
jgi:type IV pilus assembly protein PilA